MDCLEVASRYFSGLTASAERLSLLGLTTFSQARVCSRMLQRMRAASMPSAVFTSHFVRLLASFTSELLPAARRGLVPGTSFSGRHERADRFMADVLARQRPRSTYDLFDIGCGYPPYTSVDLARAWPAAKLVGVDPQLPGYALDYDGVRGFFKDDGTLMYAVSDTALARANDTATRSALTRVFETTREQLGDGARAEGDLDGAHFTLSANPAREYELANLSLRAGSVETLPAGTADYVRCLNVLAYFREPERRRLRAQLGALLKPGGFLLTGANFVAGSEAHYSLYVREAELVHCEFTFGIDNLRPLGPLPWFELHPDPEVARLARYVGLIRRDAAFARDFDRTFEALATELGLRSEGVAEFDVAPAPPKVLGPLVGSLLRGLDERGFVERAADTLRQAGHDACRNAAGELSVRPAARAASAGHSWGEWKY